MCRDVTLVESAACGTIFIFIPSKYPRQSVNPQATNQQNNPRNESGESETDPQTLTNQDPFLFCSSSHARDDRPPVMTSLPSLLLLLPLRTRQRLPLLVPATTPRLRIPLRAPIRTLLIPSSSSCMSASPQSSSSPLSRAQSPIHSPVMSSSTTLKTGSSYLRPGPVESFVSNGLKTQDYYFDLPLKHTDSSCKDTIVVFARRV